MKSNVACLALSDLLFIIISIPVRLGFHNYLISIIPIVLPIAFLIVLLLAPQDTENKRLSCNEKRRLKAISTLILILETAIIVFLYHTSLNNELLYFAFVAVVITSLGLITGFIINQLSKRGPV